MRLLNPGDKEKEIIRGCNQRQCITRFLYLEGSDGERRGGVLSNTSFGGFEGRRGEGFGGGYSERL